MLPSVRPDRLSCPLVKRFLDSLVDPYRHNLSPGTVPQGCILEYCRLG
jgi:hypothetical protein